MKPNLTPNMKMTNKSLLLVIAFAIVSVTSFAQIKDMGSLLSGSTADAEKLMQAYLKPYANAFGAGLNGSWYNSAKPHKLLGFDLTFSLSAAFIPKADKTYNLNDLGLSTAAKITNGPNAPTIAGANDNRPTLTYSTHVGSNDVTYASFKTPNGLNWGIIPAPMLQLGLGLIKETDVTVRFVPNINFGDKGSVKLWGIGVKHSIKQWIPALKLMPFFHLSVFGGYTKMTTTGNISFQPEWYVSSANAIDQTTLAYDNQKMEMLTKGFIGDVIASFDLPVITFFAGVGFSKTNTTLKLNGDYPMARVETSGADAGKVFVKDAYKLTNPMNIEMKNSDGSKTKPRLNAGIKFKMALITLHFDYTYANYSVVGTGLGISFR
jgi:hypothetical protein